MTDPTNEELAAFAAELRKWWSFDDRQFHTHTWHTREDFIRDELPKLLAAQRFETTEISEATVKRAAAGLLKNDPEFFRLLTAEELEDSARAALKAAREHNDG